MRSSKLFLVELRFSWLLGSTLIGAEMTGRNAFLVEIAPACCAVIRQRWAEFVHGAGCEWEAVTPAAADAATNTG